MSVPAAVKSLAVENFGPHQSSYIDFVSNEVAIRGTNDSGKTQLIRALQIAVFNEDLPADRIRHGENSCSITVTHVNGRSLRRTRKGAKQSVVLINPDGSIYKESTGTKGFDDEVAEWFGFRKVSLDKNDSPVNLQFIPLGAPPFLLDRGPEKLLRALSTILAGKGIETAKMNVAKALRALSDDYKTDVKLRFQIEERISYLDDPKWEESKEIFSKLEAREEDLVGVLATISALEDHRDKVAALPFDDEARQAVSAASERVEALAPELVELLELEGAIYSLICCQKEMDSLIEQKFNLEVGYGRDSAELAKVELELNNFSCEKCGRLVQVIG